jgi:ariadne-1
MGLSKMTLWTDVSASESSRSRAERGARSAECGVLCSAAWRGCGCGRRADRSDDSVSEPDIIDVMSPSIEGESYAFPEDRGTRTLLTRVTDAPAKKPYDVTYKVRTMQEIMEMQQKEVRKVQNLLEVPVGHSFFCPSVTLIINWVSSMADKRTQSSTAAILLRHYAWNAEKLQEQFWNDPARALLEAGLSPPSSPSTSTVLLPPSSPRHPARSIRNTFSPARRTRSVPAAAVAAALAFECSICCVDYPKDQAEAQTLALGCGHRFCRTCWTEYLNGKVQSEGESARIQCMENGCNRIVREEIVDELVTGNVSKK